MSTPTSTPLQTLNLAHEWLRLDKDPKTHARISALLDNPSSHATLTSLLHPPLAFGTAGLRAPMDAGFARLNALTIIQATQGLASYLLSSAATPISVRHSGIVLGYDARHNSERFARLTAAVFAGRGFRVWWYELPVHTPLVPFGVQELGAAAGVMITASHNPAADNGYKVYWVNGCQIVPPLDAKIAAAIEDNREPDPEAWDENAVEDSLLVEGAFGLVEDAYLNAVLGAADPQRLLSQAPISALRFVYTPMHGVGLDYMRRALRALGIEDALTVVPEQADPDPDFPTVRFPNPEEKGALDLAFRTADEHGLTLVIANDPDADRLAVAQKEDGKWRQFSGNEVGALLASHVLDTYRADPDADIRKLTMLASTVSSRLLSTMAAAEGFTFRETLTGFKWIGTTALHLNATGLDVAFGFEEALGYMLPSVVPDKDGITATALFLSAVARWHVQNLTPATKLQQIYEKYGFFAEANTYVRSPSPATTHAVFAAIRGLGAPHPASLGGRHVLKWRDLTKGWDSETEGYLDRVVAGAGKRASQSIAITHRTSTCSGQVTSAFPP
ncbi:hypothetical protein EJ06DRAFT_346724 [Trichodelitschia bisporula]|uniref:Phosphoglucomutase-2 n=1 Tax=Trichodelitschia bisporula TaxID=703511 RepID=A0A6G1I3G8_9PEZI|nr:hypothetical protein EJ06DRAFT_346724 [Trichodelitschia bisporula]